MGTEEIIIEETYYAHKRTEGSLDEEQAGSDTSRKRFEGDDDPDELDPLVDEEGFDGFGDGDDTDGFDDFEEIDDEDYDDEEGVEGRRTVTEKSGHNLNLGARGEDAAARYLERMGYEILDRNWSCPFGEADIIAIDEMTLVFVEVKTRTNISKGFPSEAVDARKRARYEKIAAWYLKDYEEVNVPVRFDVVALLVVSPNRAFMKHYVNAFRVES